MSLYENLKGETLKEREESKNKKLSQKLDSKEKSVKNEDKIIIGKYSDAPDYLKDNEFIKNGYLINCQSLKLVLRSLFVCSNETVNIWSHLIGCLISIILIFLTVMLIRTSTTKELTQEEYEELQIKVNETIIPWSSELRKHKMNEIGTINSNVCSIIDNILLNTENLVSNYGNKFTTVSIIEKFIETTKNLINKIVNIFTKESNILEDITTKWEICVNKIISYIKYNSIDDIKGENVGRWPLFIMLSASIVCFGFSTSFHWFSIYSKELYSLLCRLDYAGITFLIPGSCFPPYFYFYYCEKCKKICLLKYSLILFYFYRDRNIISNSYIKFFFYCICLHFDTWFSWAKIQKNKRRIISYFRSINKYSYFSFGFFWEICYRIRRKTSFNILVYWRNNICYGRIILCY